jgi:ABC-type nitrate/sulfonate/bicarbonate transport system substrate-binding protein
MIARLFPIILALLAVGPLAAQGSAEFHPASRPAFEHGPRPPQSVYDPSGYLEPELAKAISDPLQGYFKKEGIDVVVVVLPDIGQAPPEHVARAFASAWCESPVHCVVLHVPGREGSPWIVPDGKMVEYLNPAQVQQAVNDARRRSASEAKDPDKVKAAAAEAADLLRYWMANALNRTEMIQFESARMRQELEDKSRQWKIAVMVAVASAVPVLAGISLLVVFLRRRGPGYFPIPDHHPRLGAPHAGGNRAVVDLGPPNR